jgi:hypothetical protein
VEIERGPEDASPTENWTLMEQQCQPAVMYFIGVMVIISSNKERFLPWLALFHSVRPNFSTPEIAIRSNLYWVNQRWGSFAVHKWAIRV